MGTFIRYSANMAATMEKDTPPLKAVQLESLVVMKVIKHCATRFPTVATGSLVGMDNNGTLEVTNSFPFPVVDLPPEAQYEQQHFNSAAAAPRAKSNTQYQTEMIKMLREVNVDATMWDGTRAPIWVISSPRISSRTSSTTR